MRAVDLDRLREVPAMVAAVKKRLGLAPYQIPELGLSIGEANRAASELDQWVEDAIYVAESLGPPPKLR